MSVINNLLKDFARKLTAMSEILKKLQDKGILMEQFRKKRFRKIYNSNERAESSDTNPPNADQEFVQTIPTLVSEIFLEELRDVKLLKTCRLVCKSWNINASKSLRAFSVVLLKEKSRKLKKFAALLRNRELRSFQHIPTPFQNFHVVGKSFTDPAFINLVFTPSFTCTSLTVVLPEKDGVDLDQSQLSLFLAANKNSIVNLIITAKKNPGFQLNETLVEDAIRLTSVKSLKIEDDCYQCTHIQFLQNIMGMCRPAYLQLNILDDESLPSLLLQEEFKHIKDLDLFCGKFSGNVFTDLANRRFQLRTLSVFESDCVYDRYLQEWFSFLESVSPTLTQFKTNLPIGTNLRLTKLKEIYIQNKNSVLSTFTPNSFPALKEIILGVELEITPRLENCEVPHKGVEYFAIDGSDIAFYDEDEHELFMLLTFVSRQFPNVTSLDISIPAFRLTTLPDICNTFPNIKTLKLDGKCDFFSFAGFETSNLNQGLPVEMIPRRGSITDFKKLEVIKFGPLFRVHPDMIRHCLAVICKLKQIELHWNFSLSAPLFLDFVGHLDKIVISGSDKFAAEMVEVQKLLPNVVLML